MTHRTAFRALLFAILAVSIVSEAQEPVKVYRVAIVFTTSPTSELVGPEPVHPFARAFVHAMRDLGYVEGENFILDRLSAEGRLERYPQIFQQCVADRVDVIVTVSNAMTRAAKNITSTVPIVMAVSHNPVEAGLVRSLARPGGNITGFTIDADAGIAGKRVQLLKELLPKITRVAMLTTGWEEEAEDRRGAAAATSQFGLNLLLATYAPAQYADAFTFITRERPGALLVAQSAPTFAHRQLIVDYAAKNRVPAMYPNPEYVDVGGLIAYGAALTDLYPRAARYVDRILKGAKPADLPVERPSKFVLAINLKTAKKLGLVVPPSLLQQADRIIE